MQTIVRALSLLLGSYAAYGQYTITTVAGIGMQPGDGGPAATAQFFNPAGMAFDSAGNLFIADSGQGRVRMVAPDGTITTVAGTGLRGSTGDGGPAGEACLNFPMAVVVDTAGNLYIAEMGGNRVRVVTPDGTIATMAGPPDLSQPVGLALDASGNLYVSDSGHHRVVRLAQDGTLTTVAGTGSPGFNGNGRAATDAQLNTPAGIAIDPAGNLYIADTGNYQLRQVTANGTIQGFAGTGANGQGGDNGPAVKATLHNALWVAADGGGNVYIADSNLVRKVFNGIISTIAGGGQQILMPGTSDSVPAAQAGTPPIGGLTVDGSGQLYVSLQYECAIMRVTKDGMATVAYGVLHRGADDTQASTLSLFSPMALLTVAGGSVLVADSMNFRLLLIAADGSVTIVAQMPDVVMPSGFTVDSAYNIYVADGAQQLIFKADSSGRLTQFAGGGNAYPGDGLPASQNILDLADPAGIAIDRGGNFYFSTTRNTVRKIAANGIVTTVAGNGQGGFGGDGGPAAQAQLQNPLGLAVDAAGNLYIADSGNGRIRKMATDGSISTFAGPDPLLQVPTGLDIDQAGNLVVADQGSNRILRVASDGTITSIAGTGDYGFGGDGGPAGEAQLAAPYAVVRGAADTKDLYVADTYNHRIRKLTAQ